MKREAKGSTKRNAAWRGLERSDDTGPRGPCALRRPAKVPSEKHPSQRNGEMAKHEPPRPAQRTTNSKWATTCISYTLSGVPQTNQSSSRFFVEYFQVTRG